MPSPGPVRAVYVHAPFCARRCFYCDFAVSVSRRGDLAGWLRALEAELRWVEEEGVMVPARPLETLYVGGGTPSLLGPEAMMGLARLLGRDRLAGERLEWTAEANPESFTREVAEGWARAGVNRVSLGAQSFQGPVLRWMGRLHGPDGPGRAVAEARRAGMPNLSLDLIFALPPEVERDWGRDLEAALSLEPPHLSLYGLSVEKGTPLSRAVGEGIVAPVGEERYREEFLQAAERLTGAGYLQYELSNFALPGFESRHNRAYWELRPYLGLGNGAHSFRLPLRRWNLREWSAYQDAVVRGVGPVDGGEKLSSGELRLERIWLALRTLQGVSFQGGTERTRALVTVWMRAGLATPRGEGFRLTPEGWLLLDSLAVELDGSWGEGPLPPPPPEAG